LGAAVLRDPAGEVVLRFGKPLAMITYLACAPQRSCPRREIVALLWGDSPDARASNAFRQTLFMIRQLLGAGAIVTRGSDVSLALPLMVDVEELEKAYRDGVMQNVVDGYDAPFLQGCVLPGALAFEEWAQLERVALASRFQRACEVLISRHLEAGSARRAASLAHRLRDADPTRQRSWRLLLQSLLAARSHDQAILEADAFERQLKAESITPDADTDAILRLARGGHRMDTDSPDVLLHAELVGREAQFAALSEALDAARRDGALSIMITGAAGIGKSRLLEEFAQRVRALRCREASARAHRADRHVAYALCAAVAAALGRLRGAAGVSTASAGILVGLSPALSSVFPHATPPVTPEPEELARTRAIALRELVTSIAAEAPLAILIDDLHWADAASRRTLESACAGLRDEHVLVVETSREAGAGFAMDRRREVMLTPLMERDIESMLRSVGVAPDAPWLSRAASVLAASSGGSPLIALESVRLALQQGVLHSGPDGLQCGDAAALDAMLTPLGSMRTRLAGIGHAERAVLDVLALHDAPLGADVIGECLSYPPDELTTRLDPLVRQQFVVMEPDGWALAHDELSDEVLRGQSAGTARECRRRLASALQRQAESARSAEEVRHRMSRVVQLLVDAGDSDSIVGAVVHYRRLSAARGRRRDARAAIDDLLGDAWDAGQRAALHRRLPVSLRLAGHARWAAALALLVGVTAAATYARQPSALVVASAASGLGPDVLEGGLLLYPSPTIDITDRLGARLDGRRMVVRARSLDSGVALTGDSVLSADSGRIVFDRLGVRATPLLPVRLQFETVDGDLSTTLTTVGAADYPPRIELVIGRLNGQTIRSTHDTLVVRANEWISGMVETRYTSIWVSTTLLAGSPTWGAHEQGVQLLSYVWSRTSRTARQDSLRLRAPAVPGNYHYIMALGSETNEHFLFAGTNWTVGEPRWNDGNDLADLPAATLDSVSRVGSMTAFTLRRDPQGKEYPSTHGVGIIALPIRVASVDEE